MIWGILPFFLLFSVFNDYCSDSLGRTLVGRYLGDGIGGLGVVGFGTLKKVSQVP